VSRNRVRCGVCVLWCRVHRSLQRRDAMAVSCVWCSDFALVSGDALGNVIEWKVNPEE
jgi:hypothetical protein